jgi:TolB-like protein/DNA-binding winged helix-turn-helix (wHTH) protein/Tfp pilus assembly protein PilF
MDPARYRFLDFELDCARHELRRGGAAVKLENLPFDLLVLVVESNGDLVTRERIVERLWGAGIYQDTEQGINTAIRKVRQALQDDPQQPQCLQTVVGRGYRFIAPVTREPDESEPAVAADAEVMAPPSAVAVTRRAYSLIVALILLAVTGAAWWSSTTRRAIPAGRAMLAVLPFANLTGDPGQRSFGDGMTEEIITDLGRLNPSHLGVIARTSVLRYADTTVSIKDVGRDLGVAYIVEGSVRREPEKVRITAQLIRVSDQSHIWAQSYDRESGVTLALESDVAAAIAREVNGRVAPDQHNPLLRARARDPEAYALYFQGRELWNRRTEDSMRQALDRFQAAIARDPQYAAAFAGLADTYTALGYGNYLSPSEAFSKARKAAEKALDLDPDAPEPHASLGYVNMYFDWNFPAAEAEFRKSIELNPSLVLAHDWYAILMLAMGRGNEAQEEFDRAVRLDPFSLPLKTDVGFQLHYRGLNERAIQELSAVLAANPAFPLAHFWRGRVYGAEHRCQEALADLASVGPALQDWQPVLAARGQTLGACGHSAEARSILDRFQQLGEQRYVTSYGVALVHAGLGEKSEAFRWLDKAYDERSHWLVWLNLDPRWNDLRGDPRFDQLRRRVGLIN